MAKNQADYTGMLQGLLPRGPIWPRDPEATLTKFLEAWAAAFAVVDGRAEYLVEEADPRSTLELLDDWERVAGLPDSCTGEAATLQERRQELVERLTGLGGAARQFFIDLAEALGYAGITIEEFRPFLAGVGRCSDDLLNGGHEVRFNWRVTVPGARVTFFRAGESQCGDTLASIDKALDLECLFERLKPAQTELIVSYEGV